MDDKLVDWIVEHRAKQQKIIGDKEAEIARIKEHWWDPCTHFGLEENREHCGCPRKCW